MLLVFPLLWAIGRPQPPWSPGSFGLDWWIIAGSTLNGIALLSSGWYVLLRLARRAAKAMEHDYGWVTIALAACDSARDTGFVLQGNRAFSTLDARERRALLRLRLVSATFLILAAIWLPPGFALAIVLAASGSVGLTGLWLVTLAPAVVLAAMGLLARAGEDSLVRAANRAWYTRPWSQDLEREEAAHWRETHTALVEGGALGGGRTGLARPIRVAVVAGLVVTFATLLPPVTLVGLSSVSAILVQIGTPHFAATSSRSVAADLLRPHALDSDPSVTPIEAGEALHALSFVGRTGEPRRYEMAPPRRYEANWLGEGINGTERSNFLWRTHEFVAAAPEGLDPADRALLAAAAAHPAHREFEVLARAATLDAAGVRWPTPLPDGIQLVQLPVPRLTGFREGAHAHVARAALELADGFPEDAERTIREVISAGLLVADQGPTLLDNIFGLVVARTGGEALVQFLFATGREGEAEVLLASLEAADATGERLVATSASPDASANLRRTPRLVSNPAIVRGVRWELFTNYNTLGVCTNMHRILFGPDPVAYDRWIEETRASLVRFDSEAELFDLARRGWFSEKGDPPRHGVVSRLLGLPFGGNGMAGSCGGMLGGLGGAGWSR